MPECWRVCPTGANDRRAAARPRRPHGGSVATADGRPEGVSRPIGLGSRLLLAAAARRGALPRSAILPGTRRQRPMTGEKRREAGAGRPEAKGRGVGDSRSRTRGHGGRADESPTDKKTERSDRPLSPSVARAREASVGWEPRGNWGPEGAPEGAGAPDKPRQRSQGASAREGLHIYRREVSAISELGGAKECRRDSAA